MATLFLLPYLGADLWLAETSCKAIHSSTVDMLSEVEEEVVAGLR
jgi:hypothetical protein